MKASKKTLALAVASVAFGMAASARAGDVFKADNADALNLGSSWALGTAPTSGDVVVWDGTVLSAPTLSLGANTSWAGIRIGDAVTLQPAGPVTIGAGNVLTLGASGIDMSISTVGMNIGADVTLGAAQTWTVNTGQTLSTTGAFTLSGQAFTKAGAGRVDVTSLSLAGQGLSVTSGLLNVNGNLSLAAAQTLGVNTGGTLTVTGSTTLGGFGLAKSGGGIANITGITVAGQELSVRAGTLNINGNLTFTADQTINVDTGSVLNVTGSHNASGFNITKTGAGNATLNAGISLGTNQVNVNAGSLTFTGAADMSAPRTFDLPAGAALNLNGALTTNGNAITKNGAGILLIGASTTGGTAVTVNAGTLQLNGAITGASPININGGTVSFTPAGLSLGTGTITFNGGAITSLTAAGSTSNVLNDIIVPAGQTGALNLSNRTTWGNNTTTYNLTGAGTMTFTGNTTVSRDDILGSWSNFTGQVNMNGTGTFRVFINGGRFGGGLPNGVFDLGGSATFAPQTNSGGNTINFGALSGSSSTAFLAGGSAGAPNYTVGSLNTNTTFAGNIIGNAVLTKIGTGTLTLGGPAITNTGAINVNVGTLLLTGTKTAGAINVANGATFGGTGTTSTTGTTTVNSGGKIAPGTSGVGTIVLNALTLSGGAQGIYEFNEITPANDLINVTGAITFSGTTALTLYSEGTTNIFSTNGTYTVFNFGSATGYSASSLAVASLSQIPGKSYVFANSGNAITLTISGVAGATFWNVDSDGQWGTAGNWTAGVPDGAGKYAGFGVGGANITAGRTVTLGANRTVGTISIDETDSFTINGGGNSLILNNSGGVANINTLNGSHTISAPIQIQTEGVSFEVSGAANTLTVNGAISGPGPVTKAGAGTMVLNGNGTYGGSTTVSGGILRLQGTTNVLPATTDLSVGGTLDINGVTQTVNSLSGSGTVTNAGTGTPVLTINNAFSWTGSIAGSLGVVSNVPAALSVSTANPFTGGATINGAGLTLVNSAANFGSGPITVANGAVLNIAVTGNGPFGFLSNPINVPAGGTVTYTSGTAGNGFSGFVTFADPAGVVTISGGTQVSFGSNAAQFGNGTVVVPNGTFMRLSGSAINGGGGAQTTFDVQGGGNFTTRNGGVIALGALIGDGTVSSGAAGAVNTTLNIQVGGKNINASFNGTINDGDTANGKRTAITKVGTGTQTFTGVLNYTGNTTATAGKLVIAVPYNMASNTLAATTTGVLALDAAASTSDFVKVAEVGTISVATNGHVLVPTTDRAGGFKPRVLIASSVTAVTGGLVDLTNNDMILRNTTLVAARALVSSWWNLGGRDGAGIGSSLSASGLTTLAVVQAADSSSFDNQSTSSADVVIKYTYLGDTDLNGLVDTTDLNTLISGIRGGLTGWANGDTNYDGVIDGADYANLVTALRFQGASLGDSTVFTGGQVPEPAALGLLLAGAPLLGRRRR